MGTRSETYVRNKEDCVGLWRHFDGYPDFMGEEFFPEFLNFAWEKWQKQPHWLTYPADMAALLIAFDARCHEEYEQELEKELKDTPFIGHGIDIRPLFGPMGTKLITDAAYVWILDIPPINETKRPLTFHIRGYEYIYFADPQEGTRWTGLDRRELIQVMRDGKIDSPRWKLVFEKTLTFPQE